MLPTQTNNIHTRAYRYPICIQEDAHAGICRHAYQGTSRRRRRRDGEEKGRRDMQAVQGMRQGTQAAGTDRQTAGTDRQTAGTDRQAAGTDRRQGTPRLPCGHHGLDKRQDTQALRQGTPPCPRGRADTSRRRRRASPPGLKDACFAD